MSSDRPIEFTKENIDTYLKEVAKEYRKQLGKNMPAEMILIGGASVLINYGFRDMTTDIDAIIQAASAMKDVINRVGDKYNLPNDLYMKTVAGEKETRELLVEFEKNYPGKTQEANVDSIAENLQKKTSRAAILADLRKKKT